MGLAGVLRQMIRRFLGDRRGNFAMLTAIAMVPIMGALTLAIDYGEMSRQRQLMLNSLDAAGIATARELLSGTSEADTKKYAEDFFQANLSEAIKAADTTLTVELPTGVSGGGTVELCSRLVYHPYFVPVFYMLLRKSEEEIAFTACTEVQLQNTVEVALVLDNSGSMDYLGSGSGEKRIDLLKKAAKQLVDTIGERGAAMKQVPRAVQFALVPFAASVNVGTDKENATWMDTTGISPVHHENFTYTNWAANKKIELLAGVYKKTGDGWPSAERNQTVTRFSLFKELKYYTNQSQTQTASFAQWGGCVEARPDPYNVTDTIPTTGTPATLFVPMFAPDETDRLATSYNPDRPAYNSWFKDTSGVTADPARQKDMRKYFVTRDYKDGQTAMKTGEGPNLSCSTKPITALTDITVDAGVTAIKGAIDAMVANGATNVPEGMAWGWRTVSSGEPFTEGRPDTNRGNDKVIVVLTDGANTYYTPDSLGPMHYSKPNSDYNSYAVDLAGNKSIYSAYGFAYNGLSSRIFMGTSSAVDKTDFSNSNYTKAMNEHFAKLCDNAKWKDTAKTQPNIIVMTVALDLDSKKTEDAKQITSLKTCASESRFTKDPNDSSKMKKLFWNTTGEDLEKTFKEIADELSNLRIVS
jgi:Flp pilus assembly protein TadG